jgi:hypothetical protein
MISPRVLPSATRRVGLPSVRTAKASPERTTASTRLGGQIRGKPVLNAMGDAKIE